MAQVQSLGFRGSTSPTLSLLYDSQKGYNGYSSDDEFYDYHCDIPMSNGGTWALSSVVSTQPLCKCLCVVWHSSAMYCSSASLMLGLIREIACSFCASRQALRGPSPYMLRFPAGIQYVNPPALVASGSPSTEQDQLGAVHKPCQGDYNAASTIAARKMAQIASQKPASLIEKGR